MKGIEVKKSNLRKKLSRQFLPKNGKRLSLYNFSTPFYCFSDFLLIGCMLPKFNVLVIKIEKFQIHTRRVFALILENLHLNCKRQTAVANRSGAVDFKIPNMGIFE